MGSRKRRFISLLVPLAGALTLAGVIAPFASAVDFTASFAVNPTDALKNKQITGTSLDESGPDVEVHVTAPEGFEGSLADLTVTLNFVTGPGFATTENVSGNEAMTDDGGIATFPDLKIADPNESVFTDYEFEAVVSGGPSSSEPPPIGAAFASEGALSDPFDIWDAGCKGNGCTIGLRGGLDSYKSTQSTVLTASLLSSGDLTLDCPGQKLIFGDDVFTHQTTGIGAVAVTSHITAADFRAAGTNFGQAHVEWCVGIKPGHTAALNNGGVYVQQDTNNDGTDDLFVGFAPKCPKKKVVAPCIVSQMSDGKGGSITKGFLEGGDPPRRT